DVPEAVALEDPGALRSDVDGRRYRMGPGKLTANLVEGRQGRPDLPGLTERAYLNHDRMLLAGELEARDQVRGLTADSGAGAFLPARCRREKLPQPLTHLPANLRGFQHVSLTPIVSASAETLPTTKTACQAKTYDESIEQARASRLLRSRACPSSRRAYPISLAAPFARIRPTRARRSASDHAARSGTSAATSDIRANERRSAPGHPARRVAPRIRPTRSADARVARFRSPANSRAIIRATSAETSVARTRSSGPASPPGSVRKTSAAASRLSTRIGERELAGAGN